MSKSQSPYKIAIPKGALFEDSMALLKNLGHQVEVPDRKLIVRSADNSLEIIIVRATDIPVYVERGVVDLGIVGNDILQEYDSEIIILQKLNFGACRLAIAAPNHSYIKTVDNIPPHAKVATKFVNITRKYFQKKGIPVDIIPLYGSIEIAPFTGLADIIVDIVDTGKTLKANGLSIIQELYQYEAHLITNRISWQLYTDFIGNTVKQIQTILANK